MPLLDLWLAEHAEGHLDIKRHARCGRSPMIDLRLFSAAAAAWHQQRSEPRANTTNPTTNGLHGLPLQEQGRPSRHFNTSAHIRSTRRSAPSDARHRSRRSGDAYAMLQDEHTVVIPAEIHVASPCSKRLRLAKPRNGHI